MRLKSSELIYLCGYVLLIVSMYLFVEIVNKPRLLWLICPLITVVIILIIVFWGIYNKRNLGIRFIIMTLFVLLAIQTDRAYLMTYGALLCCAEITSFINIVRTCMISCVSVVLLTALCDSLGLTPDNLVYRSGVTIETFGFGWYSVVPFTFLFVILEWFYYKSERKKRISWVELIIIFLINIWLYSVTTLRLTYYLTLLVLGLYVILVKLDFIDLRKRAYVVLSVFLYPIMFGFTVWMNWIYDPSVPVLARLNTVLTGRLSLGHEGLERYEIGLFGQKIQTSAGQDSYFYIDSGYMYSLLGYGILFTFLILSMYAFLCRYAACNNHKPLFIWLITIAAFSFINNAWISLYMNPILMLFPVAVREMQRKKWSEIITRSIREKRDSVVQGEIT